METTSEQIIQEKVNSVTDLPAGYSPNLDSKWEVLTNGLKPKRKPLIIRLRYYASIAAMLLFIGGGSLLMIRQVNKPQPSTAGAVQLPPSIKQKTIPPQTVVNGTTSIKAKSVSSTKMRVKNKQAQPLIDTTQRLISPIETPLEPTLVLDESMPEKKEKRYTEIDFNNPIIGTAVPTQAYVESQRFKFKIGLSSGTKTASSPTNQPAVGLRTTF